MMQGNPKIFTFSQIFRCSLIVIATENASPGLQVPGHVDCIWVYFLSFARLQKTNSSVYKGCQAPWQAQEMHVLFGRCLQSRVVSQQSKPTHVPRRLPRDLWGAPVPKGSGQGQGRAAPQPGWCSVCTKPAQLCSPLPPSACGELMKRVGSGLELPAYISLLLTLGSRLSAFHLNHKS